MADRKIKGPDGREYSRRMAGDWQPGQSSQIALPEEIFDRYVTIAMRAASPRRLENGRWYCDLDRFPGVWADGTSLKECLDTLEEVLRDWLVLKLIDRDRDLPVIDEIDLAVISRRF